MALFSRKNRPHDEDTVRLGSADHSWWAGETVLDVDDLDDEVVEAELLEAESWEDDGEATEPAGVVPGITDALEEYGYVGSADWSQPSLPGPAESGGPEDGPDATSPAQGPVDEAALFSRDGLPDEDRLLELLGALGLEQDADWVDIARAHRRLAAPPANGRPDGDSQGQRRAANEAYACLRLFHH